MSVEIPRGPWVMPDWMKPYCGFFNNTGTGYSPKPADIERLYNGRETIQINAPLAMLEACVYSQATLLERLHKEGKL